MKSYFATLICLLTFSSQAQSFKELIKDGNQLYEEQNYLESAKVFEKAFLIEEGTSSNYFRAGRAWALTGDTTRSIQNLKLMADKGWIGLKHLKRDKALMSLHSVKGWEEVLSKVQSNIDDYEKDFDKPLKAQLEQIYIRDQTLRQLYRDAEEKFGRESEEMTYFWSLVSEQDRINEIEVAEILEEKGWAGVSLVGGRANAALFMVIQHAPLEIQEKYLPLLKASALKGESNGNHLALLEDRIQVRNGKKQTYGTQFTTDEKTGKQIVYDIWEPEYVNQRRKAVGLGPIETYLKKRGIEWTIEQKD